MTLGRPRRGPTAALAVLLVIGVALAGAVVTRLSLGDDQQARPVPTTMADRWSQNVGRALPRPQDARPAERPDDPGGALQLLVGGVIVAGLATMAVLVARQARRAGDRQQDPSEHAGLS